MAEDSAAGDDRSGEGLSGPEKPAQASGGEQSQQPAAEAAENQETDPQAEQRSAAARRTRSKRNQAQEAAREAEQQDRRQRMEARSERELAQEASRGHAAAFARMEDDLGDDTSGLTGNRRAGVSDLASPSYFVSPFRSPFDRPFITISAAEAEARYQAQMKRLSMLARADFFRAIALIIVVLAIVATPDLRNGRKRVLSGVRGIYRTCYRHSWRCYRLLV